MLPPIKIQAHHKSILYRFSTGATANIAISTASDPPTLPTAQLLAERCCHFPATQTSQL
jgi:hypothetical protein